MRLGLVFCALGVAAAQVTYQDLLKPDPANWLTYSGSFDSQRHTCPEANPHEEREIAGAEMDIPRPRRLAVGNSSAGIERRYVHLAA